MSKFIFAALICISTLTFASTKEVAIDLGSNKAAEYHSYYFGNVKVSMRTSIRYKMTNSGETPLVFQRATISGMGFDANHSCTKGLEPKASCYFTINYWPMMEGYNFGRFHLGFDQDVDVFVNVSGQAVR